MALCPRRKWLYAGGSSGGDSDDKWDIKPIYRSLAAAYGWTYAEIDTHTLPEVNELFAGWSDYPPTNILLKALVEGFGGGKPKTEAASAINLPPEAMAAMQKSALAEISHKAGNRLPILRRDKGLPKTPPVFDLETLRQKNEEAVARFAGRKP